MMRDDKVLDLILAGDIDVKNRVIYLIGDISVESANIVIKAVDYFHAQDPKKPITIKITSYGGDPYMGFAIYDTLRNCQCPIYTMTSGACMSAAVLVAAGGDKGLRYSNPNTQFMYHSGSEGFEGEVNNYIATAKHVEDFKNTCIEAITSRTKKNKSFWKKLEDKAGDTYFKADDAKKYGIIDHIKEQY